MSSLAEALEQQARAGRRCPVGQLLAALPEPDAKALTARLAITDKHHPKYMSNAAIIRALRTAGHRATKEAIADHRGGACTCQN